MSKTVEHVEQAEVALASAEATYLSELKRDCERSEGSGGQERRREEHQQSLRDAVAQCERDLEVAIRHNIEQAEVALASAKAANLSELKHDCERSEGSGAQERRREEHQQSLRDAVTQCELDLEVAKRQRRNGAGRSASI